MKKMKKKLVLAVMLALSCGAALVAQDVDALIKDAVDKLGADRGSAVEVSIAPLTVGDTETVSELSAYLNEKIRLFASNSKAFRVVPETRGLTVKATGKAIIGGSYSVGGKVAVELVLQAELDGKRLKTASFKIAAADLKAMGIDVLPANINTQKDAEKSDAVYSNVVSSNAFALKVFGSSENHSYYDGEKLLLSLLSEKNCFFKVYHIDVNNNMKMVYPNSIDTNNRLQANTERTIPEKTDFVMEAPYGAETILVVAREAQFENIESETLQVVKVSKETIKLATDAARGLSVQAKPNAVGENTVNARYSYTILEKKASIETVSYDKPSDFAAFLASVKSGINASGGAFSGDETAGTFTQAGLKGSYKVTRKEIIFTLEEALPVASTTRGLGSAYQFSFSRPDDINASLKTVQSEISKNKGSFTGNASEGSFAVQGIAGSYQVDNNVTVSIFEKPWIVPNSMIEKEVKNYFLSK
ncbi:MAG: DUF4384 domain-containing protein [Spirochaetaceae bacterium]|nr:DUF4384 domain-containing protein [Spirochaetaceae bacterium]